MMDLDAALRFAAAFAFVIGLIALLAYAAKRWRGVGVGRPGRRLQVVEALGVDAKRRLVLVRADGREHLLLVGGESDLLIETKDAADFAAAVASRDHAHAPD